MGRSLLYDRGMTIQYGKSPTVLGRYPFEPSEMMYYLYLPIHMAGEYQPLRVPANLMYIEPLVKEAWQACEFEKGDYFWQDHYIYVTAKTMYVGPGFSGNRPGWHADGYGSNGDLNFIWYNMNPTQFAIQPFADIPDDDFQSMVEMERQIDPTRIVEFPCEHLLQLDESVVHRVNPTVEAGYRTFIKISVSRHKFNLKGNSHNYLFDYDWGLHDRGAVRNLENKDFVR